MLHFASKDHELFASLEGRLAPDNDPTIDRLWNRFVAASSSRAATIPSCS